MTEDESIERQGEAAAAGSGYEPDALGELAERRIVEAIEQGELREGYDPFTDDAPIDGGVEDPDYCEACI